MIVTPLAATQLLNSMRATLNNDIMLTQINLSRDMKTHQHFFTILDPFKATAAGGGSSLFVHYFFQIFFRIIFSALLQNLFGFFSFPGRV